MGYTLSGLHRLEPLGAVAGEAIAQGELVAIHTDGKAMLAQAQTGANLQVPCVGIAAHDAASGADVSIILDDPLVGTDLTLTVGAKVYLDEGTAGAVTQAAPSTGGDAVQCVGVARTATQFAFYVGNCEHTIA